MAIQIQNISKRTTEDASVHSMPHLAINLPWWISSERQSQESLLNNATFKADSSPKISQNRKSLGLHLHQQDSSSTQSTGQSLHELGASGGANSHDQCVSSESAQPETCGKHLDHQMKSVFYVPNPEFTFNHSQVDYSHPRACVPYPYTDPNFGGVFAAYGPQTMPQMVGMAPGRVALPLDLAEDGPIYVNPKQYHGILRRRQSRAKLEAQNKLIKNRKPYLHESRHQHALNRVRGSGGRFLSTKRLKPPVQTPPASGFHCTLDPQGRGHQLDTRSCVASTTSCCHAGTVQQQVDGFLGISPRIVR